jgi:hypothetical protein
MAYYDTINLVAKDTKPDLEFTLRDSNKAASGKRLDEDDPATWAPYDLSGVGTTVAVKFRELGGSAVIDTLDTIITNGAAGQCSMKWGPSGSNSGKHTLDVPAGTYEAEIQVTVGGSTQTVVDRFKFKVRSNF